MLLELPTGESVSRPPQQHTPAERGTYFGRLHKAQNWSVPVPPKQYAVSMEVLKPLQLAKPWYCEPVGEADPIMNGPSGG